MGFISRIGLVLTFLIVAVPSVLSTAVGSKGCAKNEFWYPPTACCLPFGGPSSPPPPPKDTKCPSSHYWGNKQGCCVPSNPPPKDGPPPQCPKHWDWRSTLRKCTHTPTPPSPPPSVPSGHNGHKHNHNHKRSAHRNVPLTYLCPAGLDACPITSAQNSDYECLDTATELESCGGCTSLGSGRDCTAIRGAWNVGCEQGHCAVYTCAGGFERAPDGKSCVPLY